MAKHHKPRAGSLAYMPKVRARKETPSIRNAATAKEAVPLGFLAYKAGMTHIIAKNLDKNSPSHKMDVNVPVTVLECPPMTVFGIRAYVEGYNCIEVLIDVLSEKPDKDIVRALTVPKNAKHSEAMKKVEENLSKIIKFTLLVHTQPRKLGFGKKLPEIIELPIGGDVKAQWAYAKGILGKEITVKDVFAESDALDVIAVTKGKGVQGQVKRWGIKMQKRKHSRSGHERHVGAIGQRGRGGLSYLVPMPGRLGYHRRTEINKLIIKIGDKGEEVTPKGGFVNYGVVKNTYIILKGSIPGSTKRAIALRKSMRVTKKQAGYAVESISTESKQGV
jgi:large subunit ribosomal protein L3